MFIRFGNGSVDDLNAQIEGGLSDEDRAFFEETRDDIADLPEVRSWHMFEAPSRVIMCGSFAMYLDVFQRLDRYTISGSIGLTYKTRDDENLVFDHFKDQLFTEEGYPRYIVEASHGHQGYIYYSFLMLVRETPTRLYYQDVKYRDFYRDVLGLTRMYNLERVRVPTTRLRPWFSDVTREVIIPKLNTRADLGIEVLKIDVTRKKVYLVWDPRTITISDEAHTDCFSEKWPNLRETEKNHKAQIAHAKTLITKK